MHIQLTLSTDCPFFIVGDSEHQHHWAERVSPAYPQVHQHEVFDSWKGWYENIL